MSEKANVNRVYKNNLNCTSLYLCKDSGSTDRTFFNSNQLDLLGALIQFTLLEMECTSSWEDTRRRSQEALIVFQIYFHG